MLDILLEFYVKSDGANKKKMLCCIFAEKRILETRIRRLAEMQFRAAEKIKKKGRNGEREMGRKEKG